MIHLGIARTHKMDSIYLGEHSHRHHVYIHKFIYCNCLSAVGTDVCFTLFFV